jgi:phosphate:Na+ symporter
LFGQQKGSASHAAAFWKVGVSARMFYTFLVILGGIALILHGAKVLREGLDRLLGARLGEFLKGSGDRVWRSLLTGLGLSLLAPSSTSVSMLSVEAVRTGQVTPRRMLTMMLGADLGLTLTVQLLSIKLDHASPVFLLLGVVLFQYAKAPITRGIGQVLLSFGFLFLGIGLIGSGAQKLGDSADLVELLNIAGRHPILLVTIAAAIAVMLQSSTATVGTLIGLSTGTVFHLTTHLAAAAVVGANVGVAITTLAIGWHHPQTRRLAVANLLAKSLVAVVVIGFLSRFVELLHASSPSLLRQVANSHTGFNLLKLIMILPLVGIISTLSDWLIPAGNQPPIDEADPLYLGPQSLDTGNLALSQSMREILRVADIVRSMNDDVWRALRDNDAELARQVSQRDNKVDHLEGEIKKFLSKLASHSLDPDLSAERLRQLQYLSELESIGDLIDKNLCELVLKKIRKRMSFSNSAWADLDKLDRNISENLRLADAAFHTRDRDMAAKLLRHKDQIDRRVRSLRDSYLDHLGDTRDQADSHDVISVLLDLMTNLRRVNSHASHVAFAILPASNGIDENR